MRANRYDLYLGKGNDRFRNLVICVLLILLICAGVLIIHLRSRSPLPAKIAGQVNFAVLLPSGEWKVQPQSYNYIGSGGVLQFNVMNIRTRVKVSFSEQTTPSQFNDIPQYYPTLLTKLNSYDNIGTVNGTLYFTHPTELGGATEAVLNSNGTLLFAYPNKPLEKPAWQKMFNNLRIIK